MKRSAEAIQHQRWGAKKTRTNVRIRQNAQNLINFKKESRTKFNLKEGAVMNIFRIMDSVHDIYDREKQSEIKALLPPKELNYTERMKLEKLTNRFQALKGKQGVAEERASLRQTIKRLVNKVKPTRSFPENAFVQDIFDFDTNYKGSYLSLSGKPFEASTFKAWITKYLELPQNKPLELSKLKNEWKNKFLTFAQRRNMTLFDQRMTCTALPNMRMTDSKLTRTMAASIIREYKMMLAVDAMKTSNTLSNMSFNRSTVKTGVNKIVRQNDLDDNFIINMAQVIDPSSNVKMDKRYRFAFLPLMLVDKPDYIEQTNSTFYETRDYNEQITCRYKLVVEILNKHDNTVISELKDYIRSNRKGEFISVSKTTPFNFFRMCVCMCSLCFRDVFRTRCL